MANQEWEWQIRDSKGKWVEMGSSVSFMNAGKSVSGKVIGSPKPGYVTVEGPDGKKTTIASNRVTVTGAPAAGGQKKPDGSGAAPATDKPRRVKAIVPGGFGPALNMSPAKQAVVRAEQRAEREKTAEKTTDAKKTTAKRTGKKAVGANRGASASSTNDGGRQDKPTDKRLNGVHSTATQIERLLRIKAKEQGIGDPFGEKEAASKKKKAADAKDDKSDEKSSAKDEKDAKKDDSKDKPEKKRVDTRKKLTKSQIDQVAEILKGVMADVKIGKFSGALNRLKKAEGILSNTSAPWLLKRISWLKKGVANFSLTASGGGSSWEWQLRDAEGKWVEMGAEVRWLNRGKFHHGIVTGSGGPGVVIVTDLEDGGPWQLDSARVSVVKAAPAAKPGLTVDEPNRSTEPLGYVMDRSDVAEMRKKAEAINIRAKRRGLTGEINVAATPLAGRGNEGMYDVVITGTPRLPGGWTMAAVMEGNGPQTVVRRNPHDPVETDFDKTKAGSCDYCKTSRDRTKTYVLRSETGEVKIVGSSCLNDFLGHQVSMPRNPFQSGDDYDGLLDFAAGSKYRHTPEVIAWAIAIVNQSGFVRSGEPGATRDVVEDALRMRPLEWEHKYKRPYPEWSIEDPKTSQEIDDVLEWARAGSSLTSTEYRANLAAAVYNNWMDPKNMGLVVSAVSSYRREKDRERERAERAKATFGEIKAELLAPIGTKVVKVPVKIISTRQVEGRYGISTNVTMLDANGHRIVWWASNFPDGFDVGDQIFMSGTVKKSDEFRGTFSTVVTRAKLEKDTLTASAVWEGDALSAAGSYTWQLRDREGRWIEMGSRVSWLSKGLTRYGKVVGSAKEGRAQVRDEQSGETVNLPTSRITAAPRAPYREGWTPVDEFGMDYDPRNASNPLVLAARSLPQSDWDALPPVNWILPNAGGSALHANEPDLKDATLDKARQPGFQFRPGYVNLAVTDEEGRTHIIDGHHRVGLHVVAGHQTMPAKVIDMRYDSPEANKIRALLGQSDGPGALRPPPPTPGVRPADVNTSLTSLAAQDMPFVNNDDSGTPTNPVHVYRWTSGEKAGKSLTVDEATLTTHFTDVLRKAIDGNEPIHPKVSRADLARSKDWYRAAHQTCLDIQTEFNLKYPDAHLTLEQVAGVMAAVSPRKAWDVTHPKTGNKSGNVEDCRRIIDAFYGKRVDGALLKDMPVKTARAHTRGGMHDHVEIALRILHGEDPSVMSGTKRKSFWNCMVNPDNDYDATIDGWMASAIWRAKIKYSDGTEVDEDALDWIDHKKTRGGQTVVPGAGYILMADALRKAAKELGLTPMEAQAIYWVSVGGGRKDTQMWSWERKEKGTSKKAKAKARKAMLATGGLIT